jgi:hypothetical protein
MTKASSDRVSVLFGAPGHGGAEDDDGGRTSDDDAYGQFAAGAPGHGGVEDDDLSLNWDSDDDWNGDSDDESDSTSYSNDTIIARLTAENAALDQRLTAENAAMVKHLEGIDYITRLGGCGEIDDWIDVCGPYGVGSAPHGCVAIKRWNEWVGGISAEPTTERRAMVEGHPATWWELAARLESGFSRMECERDYYKKLSGLLSSTNTLFIASECRERKRYQTLEEKIAELEEKLRNLEGNVS